MKRFIVAIIMILVIIPSTSFSEYYTKQQVKSAQKVMDATKKLANVFVEGGHLVVNFHEYLFPYDINKRLQFVRTVADADCVLNNGARSIYFYNPGDKQIAQADRLNGVRLK